MVQSCFAHIVIAGSLGKSPLPRFLLDFRALRQCLCTSVGILPKAKKPRKYRLLTHKSTDLWQSCFAHIVMAGSFIPPSLKAHFLTFYLISEL
jgi:hypothetical protein